MADKALRVALPSAWLISDPSLTTVLRSVFSDFIDPATIGNEITKFWEEALEKFLLARKGLRQDAFVDVEYPRLVRNPIEVVRRIYNWRGRDLSCDVELRMRTFLESTSSSKYGRHSYTLAAFDMDPANLSERFSSYRTRINLQRCLRHRR